MNHRYAAAAVSIIVSSAMPGCGGTDRPKEGASSWAPSTQEAVSSTHEALSAVAQTRGPRRMQPTEVAELLRNARPSSPQDSTASGSQQASFEEAFRALTTSGAKTEIEKRTLLVAALQASGQLPPAEKAAARLKMLTYSRNRDSNGL
jgi:hypothetical protein